jgi:hypothetical protein
MPAAIAHAWDVPDRPITIHLHTWVAERLAQDAYEAFKSLPRRGVEIGGLLLARVEDRARRTYVIVEYEPVVCEHRHGPSFVLSERDRVALDGLLRRWQDAPEGGLIPVGFYRSCTRPVMDLDDEDVALMEAHFAKSGHLFLLLKPNSARVSTCALVWRDGTRPRGQCRSADFDLEARPEPDTQPGDNQPAPPASPVPGLPPPEAAGERSLVGQRSYAPPPRPASGRHWAIPLALGLLAGLGYLAYLGYRKTPLRWTPPPAATAPAQPEASLLGLKVGREAPYLRLSWDRGAQTVLNALQGRLLISDGPSSRALDLDVTQLRGGSIAYAPSSDDVTFRLELFLGDGRTAAESVRIVGGVPAALPPMEGNGVVSASRRAPEKGLPPASHPATAAAGNGRGSQPGPPTPAKPESQTEQAASVVPETTPRAGAGQAKAPLPKLSIESIAPQPLLEQLPESLPGLLTGNPAGPAPETGQPATVYVPPKPLRTVHPSLPPEIRRLILSQFDVDIRVAVDSRGKVTGAQPVREYKGVGAYLAGLAQNTVRMWSFEPAKRNGQPVAGEYMLRFSFRRNSQ